MVLKLNCLFLETTLNNLTNLGFVFAMSFNISYLLAPNLIVYILHCQPSRAFSFYFRHQTVSPDLLFSYSCLLGNNGSGLTSCVLTQSFCLQVLVEELWDKLDPNPTCSFSLYLHEIYSSRF